MEDVSRESSQNKNVGDISLNDVAESVIWLVRQECFKKCVFIILSAAVLTLAAVHTGTLYTPTEDVFVYCAVYCAWVTLCLPWLVQNLDGKLLAIILKVGLRLFAADVGVLAWSAFRGHRHLLQRGLRLKPLLEPSLSWLSEAGYNLRYGVVVAAVVASSVSIVLDKYEGKKNTGGSGLKNSSADASGLHGKRAGRNDDLDDKRERLSENQFQDYPLAERISQSVKGQGSEFVRSRQGRHSYKPKVQGQGPVLHERQHSFTDRRLIEGFMGKGHHYGVDNMGQNFLRNEDFPHEMKEHGQNRHQHVGDSLDRIVNNGSENCKFLEEERMPVDLVEHTQDDSGPRSTAKHEKFKRRSPSNGDKTSVKPATALTIGPHDPNAHSAISKEPGKSSISKSGEGGNLRSGGRKKDKSPQNIESFVPAGISDKAETTDKIEEGKSVVRRETTVSTNRNNAKEKINSRRQGSFDGGSSDNRAMVNDDRTHKGGDNTTNRMTTASMKRNSSEADRMPNEETKQKQDRRELGYLNESMRNLISLKQRMLHFD